MKSKIDVCANETIIKEMEKFLKNRFEVMANTVYKLYVFIYGRNDEVKYEENGNDSIFVFFMIQPV